MDNNSQNIYLHTDGIIDTECLSAKSYLGRLPVPQVHFQECNEIKFSFSFNHRISLCNLRTDNYAGAEDGRLGNDTFL